MISIAQIAQLGERETEDLEVAGSIPALGILFCFLYQQLLLLLTMDNITFIDNVVWKEDILEAYNREIQSSM